MQREEKKHLVEDLLTQALQPLAFLDTEKIKKAGRAVINEDAQAALKFLRLPFPLIEDNSGGVSAASSRHSGHTAPSWLGQSNALRPERPQLRSCLKRRPSNSQHPSYPARRVHFVGVKPEALDSDSESEYSDDEESEHYRRESDANRTRRASLSDGESDYSDDEERVEEGERNHPVGTWNPGFAGTQEVSSSMVHRADLVASANFVDVASAQKWPAKYQKSENNPVSKDQSPSTGTSSESATDGNNSTVESKTDQHKYLWTDIPCTDLDMMPTSEILQALQARSKGADSDVPPFLLEGLRHVKGNVISLVKIHLPAEIKKGQHVAFDFDGKRVHSVFNGDPSSCGDRGVFAVAAKIPKEPRESLVQRISSRLKASAQTEPIPAARPCKVKESSQPEPASAASTGGEAAGPGSEKSPVELTGQPWQPSPTSSSGSSSDPDAPEHKEKPRRQDYVYTDISCADLASMPTTAILLALHARNKGDVAKVPPFLLHGLRHVKGDVQSLVKIQLSATIKKGQRVSFEFAGKKVLSVFNGDPSTCGGKAVFAVIAKAPKEPRESLAKRISSNLKFRSSS